MLTNSESKIQGFKKFKHYKFKFHNSDAKKERFKIKSYISKMLKL